MGAWTGRRWEIFAVQFFPNLTWENRTDAEYAVGMPNVKITHGSSSAELAFSAYQADLRMSSLGKLPIILWIVSSFKLDLSLLNQRKFVFGNRLDSVNGKSLSSGNRFLLVDDQFRVPNHLYSKFIDHINVCSLNYFRERNELFYSEMMPRRKLLMNFRKHSKMNCCDVTLRIDIRMLRIQILSITDVRHNGL